MLGSRHRRSRSPISRTGTSKHSDRPEFNIIHPCNPPSGPTPTLRLPKCVGNFSLDGRRKFCADRRNLSFIKVDWKDSKKVNFDLNVSYDKIIRKNFEETKAEKLDRLLDWILLNKFKFHTVQSAGQPMKSLSTDFVCFRGLLTELLSTPYEGRDGWIICATKFRDTIYLFAYETKEKRRQRESQTEQQKRMCSWGYKFEQYMTEGNDVNEGVNENEEYCCVVRSRLNTHSLVYGAEVDGADPQCYKEPHSDLSAFVELKTSKELIRDRDYFTLHRYKLIKWWSQSYLVGIPRVVCGLRSMDGIVHTLKTFKVDDMPSIANNHWCEKRMLHFLNQFLDFIKKNVKVDDPKTVYKFERKSGDSKIYCTFMGQDSEWSFVPKWYYEKVFDDVG